MNFHRSFAILVVFTSSLMACQSSPPRGCPNWPNPDGNVIPIRRVNPDYPIKAAREGVEGYVDLRAVITRDGRVESAEVVGGEPPGVFDSTALKAYRRWRYCPLEAGAPDFPNPTEVRLSFQLQ